VHKYKLVQKACDALQQLCTGQDLVRWTAECGASSVRLNFRYDFFRDESDMLCGWFDADTFRSGEPGALPNARTVSHLVMPAVH